MVSYISARILDMLKDCDLQMRESKNSTFETWKTSQNKLEYHLNRLFATNQSWHSWLRGFVTSHLRWPSLGQTFLTKTLVVAVQTPYRQPRPIRAKRQKAKTWHSFMQVRGFHVVILQEMRHWIYLHIEQVIFDRHTWYIAHLEHPNFD